MERVSDADGDLGSGSFEPRSKTPKGDPFEDQPACLGEVAGNLKGVTDDRQ